MSDVRRLVSKRYYEYRHVVGFEETNLVGDIYHVNYGRWQDRCREMFLLQHTPDLLDASYSNLTLSMVRSEYECLAEVAAFDEVSVRMRLEEMAPIHFSLAFDFVRLRDGVKQLVAQGRQRVACLRGVNGATAPARVPASLVAVLDDYAIIPVTYAVVAGTGGRG
jgi:enediyne biosynthesis thioesterase